MVLGLGANIDSLWGSPSETLHHVFCVCREYGLQVKAHSRLYKSPPMGPQEQPEFVNAVAEAETRLPPSALLRRLKEMEKRAGRRPGRRWGPRPLDLDILDYAGRIINWPGHMPVTSDTSRKARTGGRSLGFTAHSTRPKLVVPHPDLHLREFVLQPLADILPHWHHPVTGASTTQLLKTLMLLKSEERGRVLLPVDDPDPSYEGAKAPLPEASCRESRASGL